MNRVIVSLIVVLTLVIVSADFSRISITTVAAGPPTGEDLYIQDTSADTGIEPNDLKVATARLSQATIDPNHGTQSSERDSRRRSKLGPTNDRQWLFNTFDAATSQAREKAVSYPRELVEYCKRKDIPYLSLISSTIATNILRVGPHQLRLLVKWGTLKAIYAKPQRYAYFIRDDVEALAKCDEFQLALALKSNRICLNRGVLQRS